MPQKPEAVPAGRGSEHDIPYAAEVKRKALHLLALVVPLGMALLGKAGALYVLVPLSLIALAGDILRARSAFFAHLIGRGFGFMMRRDEWSPLGGPITINGATWVLLSAALLTFVFPVRIAVPAFVMFMVSDAAAALVGRRFGRRHWGSSPRTVEGSAAFLLVGTATMACFPDVLFWVGALSAAAACVAEALPHPLNDNLRVPVVAAAVIFLLERFALGQPISLFL